MKIVGGQKRYPLVDELKGFSIITIVLMHVIQSSFLPEKIVKLSSLGGTGVHVFFLCSGFGLYCSQKRRPLKFWDYLKKRYFKVYSPYIFAVLLIAAVPFSFAGPFKERIVAFLSHVFLFKMFIPKFEGSFSYPLWYMSTLFQFYFTFPVLFYAFRKLGKKRFCLISLGISVFWWIFTALCGISQERIWGSFFLQYLWEFSAGMIISDVLEGESNITIKKGYLFAISVFALSIGGLMGLKGGLLKAFNDPFMALGYLSLALLIFQIIPFVGKICEVTSRISFEWYLVHMTCIQIVKKSNLCTKLNNVWFIGVSLLFSILVAIGYHFGLEIIRRKMGEKSGEKKNRLC